MNTLTALRTFGRSSLCPARRVRIFRDRLYLVRMQNTSTDQGDGHYLEEGEYVELVTGDEAKQRRDSRLNHCNAITEYTGPVFAVYVRRFGCPSWQADCQLAAGDEDACRIAGKFAADRDRWLADCQRAHDRYQAQADAGVTRIMTPAEFARAAQECLEAIARGSDWHIEIREVA